MADIVVGDVLAWEPDLGWTGDDVELQRSLTWAVTIHATLPLLPPLRGGELIIVPPRRLEQLQTAEMVGWQEIAGLLSAQPVAGIVVERDFAALPSPGVPVLRAAPEFLPDAELYLNRTITEHRAELYRLGSDLSRALSTASIGGADLGALVTVAGALGRHELLLFDESGAVQGRSRTAPGRVPFRTGAIAAALDRLTHTTAGDDRWLVQRIPVVGGDTLYLAAGPDPGGAPETARLVLTQTATAIEAFLGPLGSQRRADPPPSRESLLADLLLGRVPADGLPARAEALRIDRDEAVRVALFVGEPGFDGRIRTALSRDIRDRTAMLSSREMAVLVSERGWADWWNDLQDAARSASSVGLVRSDQHAGLARIALATRQARIVGRLLTVGDLGTSSVFELLLSVWDPAVFEPGAERLDSFANGLLGPLEAHDRERGSDLVRTLEGYLAAGGSATGAAGRLQVHRNTLGYRLKRIGELTGADLDNADTRLTFGLAFKIRQLQRLLA